MISAKPRKPVGILSLCALIGLACGIMYANRNHDVTGFIFGPILGLIVGLFLDRWQISKNSQESKSE